MTDTLSSFIEERLAWELAPNDDVNVGRLAEDIAYGLENNGYCQNPYTTYERALCCLINKRKEKECKVCTCENIDFCRLLRREGYIQ